MLVKSTRLTVYDDDDDDEEEDTDGGQMAAAAATCMQTQAILGSHRI